MSIPIRLQINGKVLAMEVDRSTLVLWLLRDDLGMTGTKYGCGEGQCGACTVLLDGRPVRSCMTPAVSASGKSITTIEGLAQNGRLHPVQQAFRDAKMDQPIREVALTPPSQWSVAGTGLSKVNGE